MRQEFLLSAFNMGPGIGVRERGGVTLGGGPRVETSLEFKPATGERNTGEAVRGEISDSLTPPGKNAAAQGFSLELNSRLGCRGGRKLVEGPRVEATLEFKPVARVVVTGDVP